MKKLLRILRRDFVPESKSALKNGLLTPVLLQIIHQREMDKLDKKFDKAIEARVKKDFGLNLKGASAGVETKIKSAEVIRVLLEENSDIKEKMKGVYMAMRKKEKEAEMALGSSEFQKKKKELGEEVIEFLQLYHSSLQNVVEGQREVLANEDFEFEDGTTVRDRMKQFEKKLKEIAGRV